MCRRLTLRVSAPVLSLTSLQNSPTDQWRLSCVITPTVPQRSIEKSMKITRVYCEYYAWPQAVPIRNGTHTWTEVKRCVVHIDTDAGITGIGIGGASPGEIAIRDVFARELVGM